MPKNHTLRQKAHQCFVQSIKLFNEQKAFVKKHYEYFLLVSEKYFADFYNIREERRSLILPCLEHGSASQNMVHRRYMKNGMSNGMVFLLPVIKTAQAMETVNDYCGIGEAGLYDTVHYVTGLLSRIVF